MAPPCTLPGALRCASGDFLKERVMGQWHVDGHTFDTFAMANDHARKQALIPLGMRGGTYPVIIFHDNRRAAEVSMDALDRVWTDVIATELI